MEVYFIFNWIFSEKRDLDVNINDYVSFKCPYDDIIHIYKVQNQHQFDECLVDEGKNCHQFSCHQIYVTSMSTICLIWYLESIVVMDCTGIADASTEFEFKIVEFSPMVTAYLFEAGRDYYYIGKFARFCIFCTILMCFLKIFAFEMYQKSYDTIYGPLYRLNIYMIYIILWGLMAVWEKMLAGMQIYKFILSKHVTFVLESHLSSRPGLF